MQTNDIVNRISLKIYYEGRKENNPCKLITSINAS